MATSSAGDNVTYAETGKSMLDNALSEILDGDCVLMHGVTRGRFCREASTSPVVDASAGRKDDRPAGKPEPSTLDSVFGATQPVSAPPEEAAKAPPPAAVKESPPAPVRDEGQWAFVLGVFKDYEQAAALARKLKPDSGLVTSIVTQGEVFYRATTRPFKLTQAAANEKPVAAIGIADAKMVAVCPAWMGDESCLVLDRPIAR